ncbi:MAG: hypothetical protein QM757_01275 [Paludibaculum sp.]
MSTAPLRQELEDLIRRDLLGPAGGEQETITEQSVRNRYLLGMLAPLKVVEVDEEPFDELADASEDNAEEGTAEPSTPAKRGVAPSTFGLSFCLDLAETAFEAEAHWGQYLREADADGKPVWKRYPRGGNLTIPLKEGNLAPVVSRCGEPGRGGPRPGAPTRRSLERHTLPVERAGRRPSTRHVLAVSVGTRSAWAIRAASGDGARLDTRRCIAPRGPDQRDAVPAGGGVRPRPRHKRGVGNGRGAGGPGRKYPHGGDATRGRAIGGAVRGSGTDH